MGNKTTSSTGFPIPHSVLKKKGIFDQFVPFLSGFLAKMKNHLKTIDIS